MKNTQKKRLGKVAGDIGPFNVVAGSHIGLVRDCNEDSYAYYVNKEHLNTFVAVADGIGGHTRGDIASKLCIRRMLILWKKCRLWNVSSEPKLKRFLENEISNSNTMIYKLNRQTNTCHPMGTTIVAGVFMPHLLIVAHAGDSRCYRLRNRIIKPLTQDHSFVAELIRKKIIRPEDAHTHPFAHIISRSIGPIPNIRPEMNIFERKPRDRFLFCSDGLINHLEDPEIEMILHDATNPHEAVKNLIYASLRSGGEDNITVLCVFT